MQIDRTKALLLVGAISSASGCTINNIKSDGTGGVQNGAGGATASTGGTAGSMSSGTGGQTVGTGGSNAVGTGTSATAGNTSVGGTSAAAGSSSVGGTSACLSSTGAPASCTPVLSIGSCGDFGEAYCNSAVTDLKAGVAQQAVTCMLALTDTCGPPYDCLKNALGQACPDSSTDALCVQALANCTDISTAAECHALVDGLNVAGRTSVVPCVESGCTYGLWSCLESL